MPFAFSAAPSSSGLGRPLKVVTQVRVFRSRAPARGVAGDLGRATRHLADLNVGVAEFPVPHQSTEPSPVRSRCATTRRPLPAPCAPCATPPRRQQRPRPVQPGDRLRQLGAQPRRQPRATRNRGHRLDNDTRGRFATHQPALAPPQQHPLPRRGQLRHPRTRNQTAASLLPFLLPGARGSSRKQ